MIRFSILGAKLFADIDKIAPSFVADGAAVLASLSAKPASSEFKPHWSKIKSVYMTLQGNKCCFCEKSLEGKIEQDVEHFRPKAEVKPWKVPEALVAVGIAPKQRADGSSEPGYAKLAYAPFNYAMACKTCNSVFKKNHFPIEGKRASNSVDPVGMSGEKALIIYPIGSLDKDPEKLIRFDALSPVPVAAKGFSRRRALVTIELFRLDDAVTRKTLFKLRAHLVRLLFHELKGRAKAGSAKAKATHQKMIDGLLSSAGAFSNCLRSFDRLFNTDPAQAEEIADACAELLGTTSVVVDDE